jgi:hypothetical protein
LVGIVITFVNVKFHLVYLKLSDTLSDSDGEDGSSTAGKISKETEHVQSLGQSLNEDEKKKLRQDKLPYAVLYAIFRILPAYKLSIDGPQHFEKQNAWREITAKLRLDPELRRDLGGQAESVLANLDPALLMHRFVILKHNAYAALRIGRNPGSVNPLYQKILQFYPDISEKSRRVNPVLLNYC